MGPETQPCASVPSLGCNMPELRPWSNHNPDGAQALRLVQPCSSGKEMMGCVMLILGINLACLREAHVVGKILFLGASVRLFMEISI